MNSMSIEEIEMRMPELCANNPSAKYYIYASVNKLTEAEKEENDKNITSLMIRNKIIRENYLNKCVIDANFNDKH